ncbi:histidine kinase [Janibacter melonis]|uniref:Histidine kinase n=1 Tax=Janibacter melonis TaxID=262209 RepID=A0A176Q967_9MICO|nr:response regulator [Janibacter melonis]OAB86220.1 histidine kinase [Janibacter melonis]
MAEQTVVVVADDDDDIRDLVAFKLENAGYEVISVADGDSAWDRVREVRPTLAVLDVMMPGMSGLDVLREIRADESLAETKVILLTARSRDVDVDAGFSSGADDYLTKPFSPRELVHRVSSLLARG